MWMFLDYSTASPIVCLCQLVLASPQADLIIFFIVIKEYIK